MRGWGARSTRAAIGLVVALALALPAGHPATAAEDDLVYVALGDSFTSGPLVLPHDTTWVPEDCGQSTVNYPHLAAAEIGATSFTDVSCGGATIDDLYEPQGGLPLGGVNAAQLEALGPGVDVVTIGMGGNDVGFVGLALGCIRAIGPPVEEPCSPAYTAGGTDLVSEQIAAVGPELGQGLRDIQAAAPDAEVFVVGYPTSLPDDGVACWPYVPILPADMPYLVAKFKEMNAMLATQAAANGATYIDIYTSSIGHDACQLPLVAWVNGVVLVPPSYPAHPNQLSFANSGKVVAIAIEATLEARTPTLPAPRAADPSGPAAPAAGPGPRPAAAAAAVGRALPATGGSDQATVGLLLLAGAVALAPLRRARRDSAVRSRSRRRLGRTAADGVWTTGARGPRRGLGARAPTATWRRPPPSPGSPRC